MGIFLPGAGSRPLYRGAPMNTSKVSVDEIDVRGKWGLLQYYDVYLQGLMDRVGLFEVLTSYGSTR